jgi:hypothetical protein
MWYDKQEKRWLANQYLFLVFVLSIYYCADYQTQIAMEISVIQNRIYEVRGYKVMLDYDLAELYEVETRVLNQAVKRNPDRFPEDFMFRLTENEWAVMRSQFVTASTDVGMSSQFVMSSRKHRGEVYLPYAFTEHGVTILASVLRSKKAADMNIAIVRTFIAMRHIANNYQGLWQQIQELRQEMQTRLGEHDTQLSSIYDALENMLDKKQDELDAKENWKNRPRIGFKK